MKMKTKKFFTDIKNFWAPKISSEIFAEIKILNKKTLLIFLILFSFIISFSGQIIAPAPSGEFNWSIPYGYNLLNDSLNLGTFEGIGATSGAAASILTNENVMYLNSDRWYSTSNNNQNITINFTKAYDFDTIEMTTVEAWGYDSAPNNTNVWVSDDGATWTNVWSGQSYLSLPSGNGVRGNFSITPQTARYVKLEFLDNWGDGSTIALGEIRLYRSSTNLVNLTTTAITKSPAGSGSMTDYVFTSYYQANVPSNQILNFTFNFSAPKFINSLEFWGYSSSANSRTDIPVNYSLLTSTDGATWTEIQNGNLTNSFYTSISFPEQNTQYLRFLGYGNYTPYYTIREIRIFEQPDTSSNNTINIWNCSTNQLWSNSSCWSLGRVPQLYDNVVINGSGTGSINITNNTMPQGLSSFTVEGSYGNGKIYFAPLFAQGNWSDYSGTQEWNVWGDINISNGTMYVYGDAYNVTEAWMENPGMHNITAEGHGQIWKSVSGNINIGSAGKIDGVGLGFFKQYPYGIIAGHGGFASNTVTVGTYGNAFAPTSLGSGGSASPSFGKGGGAIKLYAEDTLLLDGVINMSGEYSRPSGAGGSIWLIADNLIVNGIARASGGGSDVSTGGGGGRIRFDFNSFDYNGIVDVAGGVDADNGVSNGKPGTFSWGNKQGETNYTWPENGWTLNRSIGLPSGNYTINGNLIIPSGITLGVHPLNDTASDNGTGVAINVLGNVTIETGGKIDGYAEGFKAQFGPGYTSGMGGTHGGRGGGNTKVPYGSENFPTSLGSSGLQSPNAARGGGAIKLNLSGSIVINGTIDVGGQDGRPAGAGGSTLLIASEILGNGNITASGGIQTINPQRGGGGGRIALHAPTINFSGNIINEGGFGNTTYGSGGTVYINATTIYNSGNISVVGYNGSSGGDDWGQRINITGNLITLSNVYNASAVNQSVTGVVNGTISITYTDCASSFTGTFKPDYTLLSESDCTSPSSVEFVSPSASNNSYYSGFIPVNISAEDDTAISAVSIFLYNSSLDLVNTTVKTSPDYFVNFTSLSEGIYYANATANDTNGNENSTSETRQINIDTTFPLIDFISPTPSNNSGVSGSFTINVSITEENLKNVTYNWNGTLTIFNSSNESLTDLGNGNWVFTYTQAGLVVGQSYTYNVSISDYADNINSTQTRIIRGNTAPIFVSVSYTPNSTDDLDPDVNVSVIINVSDTDNNFDSAILQWKNSSVGAIWNNVSMTNTTAKSDYTILNATLTLPSYESNITFRIWANDTQSVFNVSSNYTILNFWDCTWNISSNDLGATAGWDINKNIGNITINNTGDSAFSTSNCTLTIRLTHDLTAGRIYFDGSSLKPSNSFSISAKSSRNVSVNATFLTEVRQENVIISINEISSDSGTNISQTYERNTTATLVSNQNGPYLYQTITSYPTSVYLTPGNFSLEGYLRNLMGSSIINPNNTAYNVSFYWTMPSGLTNASGNLTQNFTNITNNNLHYNNLEVSFSNLASMSSGTNTFYLYSYGYNLSGSLIIDANNNTLLTNAINISFLCYNVSDSVCVTSCGYIQDSDCSAPATATTTPSTSSGGGGGGGSAANAVAVRTSADFQLIRGEQNEVKIVFENKDKNESLKDLIFSVSGKISKYIDIAPKQISYLGPEQKITITLTITSPTYIELGKQELTISMNGKKGASEYIDSKKITLEIHELSVERAEEMLNESRELITQLNEANLSSDYLNKLLNESETEMNTFNLEVVRNNYNIIKEQVKYALDSMKIINELDPLIKSAEKKGIGVSESIKLLKLAKLSIERSEFEQAYSRVKDSQLTYALEVKGEFGKLSYYIKEYPGEIALGAMFLVIFSFGSYKINRLRQIKKRLKELKNEEKILNELIRVVQKECFKDKKMSMDEYETAMQEYNKKLSKVIEEMIEMETKRVHMLRFTSKSKMLKFEKEKIITLIKELQEDYMKKKKLEIRTFELKIRSFNKRLGEIEEKLATLEAEKAVRGFRSLRLPRE